MTEIVNIDTLQENLAELLTNTVEQASVFYDIFLNPEPMDIELKMFDNNNQLISVIIPNRAKDKIVSYMGEGSPEGVVAAPMGSTYIDTLTSTIYYKTSGGAADSSGWSATISQRSMSAFIANYLLINNYITSAGLNTYLNDNNYVTTSDVASSTTFGVVKVDNDTVVQSGTQQLNVMGIKDNNFTTRKLWVGLESAYRTLYINGNVSANTFYVLTDRGQILLGDKEITCNSFPSNVSTSLSLSTSGSSYTAPANGWFLFNMTANASNGLMKMKNSNSKYTAIAHLANGDEGAIICPAIKGDSVVVTYGNVTKSTGNEGLIFIEALSNLVTYT